MTQTVVILTKILSVGVILIDLSIVAFLVWKNFRDWVLNHYLKIAFVLVTSATLLSLFYSQIAGFVPCNLCWWQRIFMFPLVIIFGLSAWKKDDSGRLPGLIMSAIGSVLAIYHTYIQFGGTPFTTCKTGVSCTTRYFVEFGYVTIPTMSLSVFLAVFVILLYSWNSARQSQIGRA